MATKAQKVRVGIFTAVAGALLAVVLVVFGGMSFWEKQHRYYIVFEDSVMGLENGALVYLNGIKVGAVSGIEVDPADLQKVRVTIEIKDDAHVKSDTQAMLQYAGITGLRVIDLRGGTYASAPLPPGGTIPLGQTVIDRLQQRAETVVDQTQEIMTHANRVVANLATLTDPKDFEGVKEIVVQAKTAAANLAETSATLKAMAAEDRVAIRATIKQVQTTVATVGTSAEHATAMLDGQVTQLVGNANEVLASMKGMVTSSTPLLRSSLYDLRQASRSFKELAREVRQKPSRLFFSDAPGERKLP